MAKEARTTLLWSNAACLAPAVAIAAVLGATALFNARVGLGSVTLLADGALEVAPAGGDLAGVSEQLLARLGWAVTAIALLLMTLVALGGGLACLYRWLGRLSGRRRAVFLGTALALLALVGTCRVLGVGGDWLVAEPEVFDRLRGATLKHGPAVFPLDPQAPRGAREDLRAAIAAEDRLAALAVPRRGLTDDERRALVVERGRGLRVLLYLGCGVLVLHALEIRAFYSWPGAWLSAEQAELVDRMAQAVSTANGAFFCLLLLALYLPAAGVLRLRGLELAAGGVAGELDAEGRKRAREEGLLLSPVQELSNLLVTLGPLVAGGPLAGALDLLRL